MSVIIKDMEMPENCAECKLKTWTNTEPYCFVIQSKLEWNKYSTGSWFGIDTRCPVLPLPEKHGRLIDADALPRYTGYVLSADEVATAVENAPTIVEAEG